MGAPHYKTVLASMNEYLPDAQASRDFYFQGKAQAMIMPSIATPGLAYFDRTHLFQPSVARANYGVKSIFDSDALSGRTVGQRSIDERIYGEVGRVYQ